MIRLGQRSVCRGYHKNQLVPGNTDRQGRCLVGFGGKRHHLPHYQVLTDEASTSRLEWQKWTMRRVCEINNCSENGKPWEEVCTLFDSPFDTPFVTCVHNGNHQYPQIAPELIVEFFRENRRPS